MGLSLWRVTQLDALLQPTPQGFPVYRREDIERAMVQRAKGKRR